MGLFDFFKKPSFIPHQTIVIDTETNVSIGQPAVYPTQIIEVLRNLFKNEPGVNAAYMGWIYVPTKPEPPHLIFALDFEGDRKRIFDAAGEATSQFLGDSEFVDFIDIHDNSTSVNDYFLKQTKPFYSKLNGIDA